MTSLALLAGRMVQGCLSFKTVAAETGQLRFCTMMIVFFQISGILRGLIKL